MQTRIRKTYIINSILVSVWIISLFTKSVTTEGEWVNLLLCQLFHANLFHLLANCIVLNNIRFSWNEFFTAYLIGTIAMTTATEPTLGISAVIYALLAFRMTEVAIPLKSWIFFVVINCATAFIPHIAFRVHLTAFVIGLVFVLFKWLNRRIDEYRRIA